MKPWKIKALAVNWCYIGYLSCRDRLLILFRVQPKPMNVLLRRLTRVTTRVILAPLGSKEMDLALDDLGVVIKEISQEQAGRPTHVCNYQWVQCNKCLPDNSKGAPCGQRKGAGFDEYGNECQWCHGRGFRALCAQCEVEGGRL